MRKLMDSFVWFCVFGGFFHCPTFGLLHHQECHRAFYTAPICIDHPEGYYCNCGPGFRWNSRQCIAAGVDSKMVFQSSYSSFSKLERQIVPIEFTVSFWLKPRNDGTILSFMSDSSPDGDAIISIDIINIKEHFNIFLKYRNNSWVIPSLIFYDKWSHFIWTQDWIPNNTGMKNLKWIAYVNGLLHEKTISSPVDVFKDMHIILGQYSQTKKSKLKDTGFAGDITQVNIWNSTMNENDFQTIHKDCSFNYCGNIVQWTQFRYGTHGSLQLKWPSGLIVKKCSDTPMLVRDCDMYCSKMNGIQCKVEIKSNIEWHRTKANTTVEALCPMPQDEESYRMNDNVTADFQPPKIITRFCRETGMEGKWEEPNNKKCISQIISNLTEEVNELQKIMKQCQLKDSDIIRTLEMFANVTDGFTLQNSVDLSICVKAFDEIVSLKEKQESRCPRFSIEISQRRDNVYQNHFQILKLVLRIASNLFDKKNMDAWNYTRPGGFEGRKLLGILHKFFQSVTENSNNLIIKYLYMPREMTQVFLEKNIIFKIQAFPSGEFIGSSFPDYDDLHDLSEDWSGKNEIPTTGLNKGFLNVSYPRNGNDGGSYVVIAFAIYRSISIQTVNAVLQEELRERTGQVRSLRQRINSEVVDISVSLDGKTIHSIKPKTLKMHFLFNDISNISNPSCLVLSGNFSESKMFIKSRSHWRIGCDMVNAKLESTSCICDNTGTFTVATDMFNEMWNKKKIPDNLMGAPSYFGCSVSSILCTITLFMLIYLRTSTGTSSVHKNFSIAIIAAQISFMIGIDKYEYLYVCRIFALSLHYFFLSCFAWLMNEAFNLYIVITYAAHSHGDSTDGSMWRFYLLGWIMPAVLVSAIAGINRENYFATEMCWINKKDKWLFLGPAIAIIVISVLVLIFTAKEHHESSYTKNEKDNKAIINHTKAIWTQIILLTLSWSFAFISVRLHGIVVKYLYGLFNCLQGSFYIVFYYLLNDEVQKIYGERNRQRNHKSQAGTGQDSPYIRFNDSFRIEKELLDNSKIDDNVREKRKNLFDNVIENLNFRSKHREEEAKDDEKNGDDSDYELITTV